MFLVGLTGGISTGKSLVSSVFSQHGIVIIDADQIAREVVKRGTKTYDAIVEKFGSKLVDSNTGELNREKLGSLVFADVGARRALNSLTHPAIQWRILQLVLLNFLAGQQFVVLDFPLLVETNSHRLVQKIVVVRCKAETQLCRLMSRNDLSEDEARRRIAAQIPLERKVRLANFVVENDGTLEETREQVEHLIAQLRRSKLHWISRIAAVAVIMVTVFFGIFFLVLLFSLVF